MLSAVSRASNRTAANINGQYNLVGRVCHCSSSCLLFMIDGRDVSESSSVIGHRRSSKCILVVRVNDKSDNVND